MNVISLFEYPNSIEEGFELAGFVFTSGQIDGIITGPISSEYPQILNEIQPLFFLSIYDSSLENEVTKNILNNIDYTVYTYYNVAADYGIKENNIVCHIGFLKDLGVTYEFPTPTNEDIDDQDNDNDVPVLMAFIIATSILQALNYTDKYKIEYEKYYNFDFKNAYEEL